MSSITGSAQPSSPRKDPIVALVVNVGNTPKGATIGVPVTLSRKGISLPRGMDRDMLAGRGFNGQAGQVLVIPGSPTKVLLGLGEVGAITVDSLRSAAASLVRAAWNEPSVCADLVSVMPAKDAVAAASAVTEGALLAAYTYDNYRTVAKPCALTKFTLTGSASKAAVAGVEQGSLAAEAVKLARDLVNTPAGDLTPTDFAVEAERIAAATGIGIQVWDEHRIEQERLGGLRGVSLGSDQPPRLVRLEYVPEGVTSKGAGRTPTLAVVGKGITFDSGGLSLKSGDGMMSMKMDMGGAAATLALFSVIARLAPPVRVIGYCVLTENMPGPSAIKPGDVLRGRNGKTFEVLNTDAEGRLVLADGLALAVEDRVDAIVDLATLTGAIIVALGKDVTGVFSNHQGFAQQVLDASSRAGESMWQMPMPAQYRRHIDSSIADMKNLGSPGQAGSIAAAFFLKEFVGDVPWVHLDIAGTAWSDVEGDIFSKGGTGAGVRTLIELVSSFSVPRRSTGS